MAKIFDLPNGMPLGMMEQGFEEVEYLLAPGSSLLIYSDGLAEAANSDGEEFGVERIRDACSSKSLTPELLMEGVRSFSLPCPLNDDATALSIERDKI